MGVDTNFYVGVYAKIPEAEQVVKEEIYGCSDQKCKNHKYMSSSNKFCPICGSPGIQYKKETKLTKTVNWYDFANECGLNEDAFYQANDTNYLIGNTRSYGENMSSYGSNTDVEYEASEIKDLIQHFKVDNDSMIKMFKDTYGVDMEIVFGAFIHYS